MSVKSWCLANGVCEQTYYRNLHKLREEACTSLPVPANTEEKPIVFMQLEVTTPVTSTQAAVIIRLPQATVEINKRTRQQTIQAVLIALQSAC